MGSSPSNSFHYLGIGKEDTEHTAVPPTCFIKYSDFKGNATIETEEDGGHMGGRGKVSNVDRTKAFSEPEIQDRLRPEGGLEHILEMFFGNVMSGAVAGSTGAYQHDFNEGDTLPSYTLTHGFNYASEKARQFAGCMMNEVEFTFKTDESPSYSTKLIGDYPKFGVDEPTLSFAVAPPFKSNQLKVYLSQVGANITEDDLIACFIEGKVKLGNSLESSVCASRDYGEVDKDMGDLIVEGSMTIKYTQDTQRIWATGSILGEEVSALNFARALRFAYEGGEIEESNANFKFQLDVFNAEITNVTPTEGGDGSKTFELEFTGMVNAATKKAAAMIVSGLAEVA